MSKYKLTLDQRWHTKFIIRENGCWEWTGALRADGYGILKINGRCDGAHRYSYIKSKGEIPPNMCVCHTCDNRKCINPDHLWVGTKYENNMDTKKKKRYRNKATGKLPSSP